MPTDLGNRLLTRAALRQISLVGLHFHGFRCPAGPFRLAYARGSVTDSQALRSRFAMRLHSGLGGSGAVEDEFALFELLDLFD